MRYKENFKKGMVRLIISTGISYKKLSELTMISQPTLKKWGRVLDYIGVRWEDKWEPEPEQLEFHFC